MDWLSLEPETVVRLSRKPVIMAQRIVGGDDHRVMMIELGDRPVGTAGTTGRAAPITDASAIAQADAENEIVGSLVRLNNVKITGAAKHGGFFVSAQNRQLYVKSADASKTNVSAGQNVSIGGVVMEMPAGMGKGLNPPSVNRHGYVYATDIDVH